MVSDCIDRPAREGASGLGFVIGIRHNELAVAIRAGIQKRAEAKMHRRGTEIPLSD